MPVTSERPYDLIVVGGGPTGIAALLYAGRYGLRALGIEAGPTALHCIANYHEGMRLSSWPREFEVGGYPLDSSDDRTLTREDVLSYFGRLINLGTLQVRTNARVTGFLPTKHGVLTTVRQADAEEVLFSKNVLVTAWYQSGETPKALCGLNRPIYSGVRNTAFLLGRRHVVLGGGQSGYEQAVRLMMLGQAVTLLCRGQLSVRHEQESFRQLLEATDSQVCAGVTDISGHDGVVSWHANTKRHTTLCDGLVLAIGRRPSPDMLRILVDAEVLTFEERSRIVNSFNADDILQREEYRIDRATAYQMSVAEWPNLRRWLIDGVHGIRFAGGIVHPGGSRTGTMISIRSARLAVDALAGRLAEIEDNTPLPLQLVEWGFREWASPTQWWEPRHGLGAVELIRPIQVARSDRRWPLALLPNRESSETHQERIEQAGCWDEDVLDGCTGKRTVGEILSELYPAPRASVAGTLDRLWHSGRLSWLPPSQT